MNKVGLYVHIPFCEAKCPYCDFYSIVVQDSVYEQYVDAVCTNMRKYKRAIADTLYFGGGTPSILPPYLIKKIVDEAKRNFDLDGELTMEANPCTVTLEKLKAWKEAGINRLSFGMQSANKKEQQILGRRHTTNQVYQAVDQAKQAGFDNVSVDLMLAVPYQTVTSLKQSISFLNTLDIQHVSAYLLKVEPNTRFYKSGIESLLPDEDLTCELYLTACEELEKIGFNQYEVSNFARDDKTSKHNLKYWNSEDYIGFGPSSHSFYEGKRYYYPRDLEHYIETQGKNTVREETSLQAWEDYLMLRLRLTQGVNLEWLEKEYHLNVHAIASRIDCYIKAGFMQKKSHYLSFTPKGFLVSNAVISSLMDDLNSCEKA